MRTEEQTSLEVIETALDRAYAFGERGPRKGFWFHGAGAAKEMVFSLDKAGFTIVPHSGHVVLRNCACCCDQPTVPPDCPACKGVGGFPTPFGATVVTGNALLVYGGLVHADGTVTPLGKAAMDAGVVAIGERPLVPGRSYELPHGTELRWPDPKGGPIKPPELYALTPAAIKAFVESVPLTQEAISAGSDALEREIERSYSEPLDAVPDEIADQRAEAIGKVIQANRLIAQAGQVLGAEAVELLLENLAVPDLEAAA